MLEIFACSDQLIYFDVLCVYVNHYVLLTRLFEVLRNRVTGVPDVFEPDVFQVYNHKLMWNIVKGESDKEACY